MIERGDADVPPVGARIPYVITTRGGPDAKQAVSAESPAWFAEHGRSAGLKVNYAYYIRLLRNPLQKILQYTKIPVEEILSVGTNSLLTNGARSVVGVRSTSPVLDFVKTWTASQKRKSIGKRTKRRLLVGKRRRR